MILLSETCNIGGAINCLTCDSSKNRTKDTPIGECYCDPGTYDSGIE